MIELNVGKTGATRQTWRDKTFRELLVEIISSSPKGPESKWRTEFNSIVRDEPEYFDAVCAYAFDNALIAIKRAEERSIPTAEQRAARAEAAAKEAKEHAERVSLVKEQIILLNQEMPNGQRLRFCTLDYLWRLGGKYRIIGKEGSSKLVGQVYNEEQYRCKLGSLT